MSLVWSSMSITPSCQKTNPPHLRRSRTSNLSRCHKYPASLEPNVIRQLIYLPMRSGFSACTGQAQIFECSTVDIDAFLNRPSDGYDVPIFAVTVQKSLFNVCLMCAHVQFCNRTIFGQRLPGEGNFLIFLRLNEIIH